MKNWVAFLLIAIGTGCGKSAEPQSKAANSEQFIQRELGIIKDHAKLLVASGHMSSRSTVPMYTTLGRYSWHGDGNGYFGAYSFYEPAFEQAERAWFLDGEVLEGSNELQPQDDFNYETQGPDIKFDESVIGYKLPPMRMSWVQGGKVRSDFFTATIIGIKEEGHTLILSKRAPHYAERKEMKIVPGDWKDMCECTNNSGPTSIVEGAQ